MIAQRYGHVHGYDPVAHGQAGGRISARNACANPDAIFYGQTLTTDDVLASPMIAEPLHMLEIVRPVRGGTAVVIANADVAQRSRHRPVRIAGYGEGIAHKSPQWAADMLDPPLARSSGHGIRHGGPQRRSRWTARRSMIAIPSRC